MQLNSKSNNFFKVKIIKIIDIKTHIGHFKTFLIAETWKICYLHTNIVSKVHSQILILLYPSGYSTLF